MDLAPALEPVLIPAYRGSCSVDGSDFKDARGGKPPQLLAFLHDLLGALYAGARN